MKYTFTADDGEEKTVSIPDDYIRTNKRNLGLTTNEAIHLWLFDNGYEENAEADALTEKAKDTCNRVKGSSKRKAPTRKPDYIKRTLISEIKNSLTDLKIDIDDTPVMIENVTVQNVERVVRFQVGEDTYELTLSKKRKTKN